MTEKATPRGNGAQRGSARQLSDTALAPAAQDPLTQALAASLRPVLEDVVREMLAEHVPAERPTALLTRAELARELRVCSTIVSRLVRDGMPHVLLGTAIRFEAARCLEWLRGRNGAP
jgi:hypothetical protein